MSAFLATFKAKRTRSCSPRWQAAVKQHEARFGTGEDLAFSYMIANNDLRCLRWEVGLTRPTRRPCPGGRGLCVQTFMRKSVSVPGATGGVGKSSLLIVEALSLVTGRSLLHQQRLVEASKVCLVNVEDSPDEMDLRIAAAMQLHGVAPREIAGRLKVLVWGHRLLRLVRRERRGSGMEIVAPVIDMLVEALKQDGIDALCLDPLAMLHQGEENSNEDMLQVVAALRQIALRANVAVRLVHHTRKMGGERADGESLRGASSLFGGARQVDVINTMTAAEAGTLGRARRRTGAVFQGEHNAKANYARQRRRRLV